MKSQICPRTLLFTLIVLVSNWLSIKAQTCNPRGKIIGRKPPQVSKSTKATLTLNSFQKGGDGGSKSECDGKFHPDNTPVVALSTGWFSNRKRCLHFITISGNGRSVRARVVDECDSKMGCDKEHDFQPPCPNNIVDGSKAVWKALGVPESADEYGQMEIHWSDA